MGFHHANIMHGNMQRLSYHAAGYNPILVPYYDVGKCGLLFNTLNALRSK